MESEYLVMVMFSLIFLQQVFNEYLIPIINCVNKDQLWLFFIYTFRNKLWYILLFSVISL